MFGILSLCVVPLEGLRAILQSVLAKRSADPCVAEYGGDEEVPSPAEADAPGAPKQWMSVAKYLCVRPYTPCAKSISVNAVSVIVDLHRCICSRSAKASPLDATFVRSTLPDPCTILDTLADDWVEEHCLEQYECGTAVPPDWQEPNLIRLVLCKVKHIALRLWPQTQAQDPRVGKERGSCQSRQRYH